MKTEAGLETLLCGGDSRPDYKLDRGSFLGRTSLKYELVNKIRDEVPVGEAVAETIGLQPNESWQQAYERAVGVPAWSVDICLPPESEVEGIVRFLEAVPVGAELDFESISNMLGSSRIEHIRERIWGSKSHKEMLEQIASFYESGSRNSERERLISTLDEDKFLHAVCRLTLEGGASHVQAANDLRWEWGSAAAPDEVSNLVAAIDYLADEA